jgi:hypothetical protein
LSSIINSEDENSRQGVTGGAVGGPPEFEEIEEDEEDEEELQQTVRYYSNNIIFSTL